MCNAVTVMSAINERGEQRDTKPFITIIIRLHLSAAQPQAEVITRRVSQILLDAEIRFRSLN